MSTPLAAQASWWSSWVCQSKTKPEGISKVTTSATGAGPVAFDRGCPALDTECQCTTLAASQAFPTVVTMNENHARLCSSPEWMGWMADELMPCLTRDIDLGGRMLEIGPGPGAATEWLRHACDA